MTNQEIAIADLKVAKQIANGDQEVAHVRADRVLCQLLRSLGYDDVVDLYETIDKWYA